MGIKKTWSEHICQYVSMFIHPTWWLGLIMFHCGVETLQFVDGKDLYLRLVDECLVEWVEPTHQNLGPLVLAHSVQYFIMFGIVWNCGFETCTFSGVHRLQRILRILECHWFVIFRVFSSSLYGLCWAAECVLALFFPGRTVMAAMLICHKSVSAAPAAAYLPFRCSPRPLWTWRGFTAAGMGGKHRRQGLWGTWV